jgi:hypothetical protein
MLVMRIVCTSIKKESPGDHKERRRNLPSCAQYYMYAGSCSSQIICVRSEFELATTEK